MVALSLTRARSGWRRSVSVSGTTMSDMKAKLALLRESLTQRFESLTERAWPQRLSEACMYSLFSGGSGSDLTSRSSPLRSLEVSAPPLWAMSVELIHSYGLIHDDLPAMDDDDERRGQPTCHKRFDEATILAGDALLTEAFRGVAAAPLPSTPQAHPPLGAAAGGEKVGGQVDGIEGVRSLEALRSMQRRKTGALIHAALVGGAECVGASAELCAALSRYGEALGLLFQITDDLLDEAQDAERGGNSFLT